MSDEAVRVAILFADICDSTPLYERDGDALAQTIIAGRLDDLAAIAREHDGAVVRSKGDDVLCTFEHSSAALDAAAAMVSAFGGGTAPIRVGVHRGSVIPARSDIFGDAVNVAARILALANPGEAVTSRELLDDLRPFERERLRLIGRREIKGKVDPIELYSLFDDEDGGDTTQIVWNTRTDETAFEPETITIGATLVLDYEGRTARIADGQECLIGRADRCDFIVDSPSVSRGHARITVEGGHVRIVDQSSTGTWIIDSEGTPTTLRRDSARLYGAGVLRLGRHPNDDGPAVELRYSVRHDG